MAFSTFEARARRNRLLLPLAAGAALAIIVIIVGINLLGSDDDTVTPAQPIATDPPAPSTQPPDSTAPAPAPVKPVETTTVKVRITSTPDDATVVLDGERLGRTPLLIERPRQPGAVWVKVRKKGYKTRKLEVDLGADVTWDITLPPSR